MSVVMLELTPAPVELLPPPEELTPPPVESDAVVLVDDVEDLSAFNRCSCGASDDQPY
jgi:hypothetical protein